MWDQTEPAKSTLAKIIAEKISIDSGERRTGYNTVISYFSQDIADSLDPELDLIETLEEAVSDKSPVYLRNLLGSFLFSGDDVFKKVGVLSGGEKNRVALAKIFLAQSNLIILDEPTNHLDYSSTMVLQKALQNFSGSLILVSHDIDFLRPIVNRVAYIRKGKINLFPDGIDYFLSKRLELQENVQSAKKEIKESESISRKNQKRIEAEFRQKKYQATKDIVKKIKSFETKIEGFEQRKKELEIELLNTDLYQNPELMRDKNAEFNKVKTELEKLIREWEINSAELQRIEDNFN